MFSDGDADQEARRSDFCLERRWEAIGANHKRWQKAGEVEQLIAEGIGEPVGVHLSTGGENV